MSDVTTLEGLLEAGWTLAMAATGPDHPARLVSLATVSTAGGPEVRTVVLRSADPRAAQVEVQTDLHSDKITSLRARPEAAIVLWDEAARLQLRLTGGVAIRHGEALRAVWEQVPDLNRQSYGITPAPGTPIEGPLDYVKRPDLESFAVLDIAVESLDIVHLGERHRRAVYRRADGFAGQWLVP